MGNLLTAITSTKLVRQLLCLDSGVLRVNADNMLAVPSPFYTLYHAPYYEMAVNTDLIAGTNDLNLSATPAGHVRVVTNVSMYYTGTVTNVYLFLRVFDGGSNYEVLSQRPPVTRVVYSHQCWIPVPEAYSIRLHVEGATVHDDAYLFAIGYEFLV